MADMTMIWLVCVAVGAALVGWGWGTAYGYRRGMAGRGTLIDPIAKFLKGQDDKRAREETRAWEDRTDALREAHKGHVGLLSAGKGYRMEVIEPDPLAFIKPSRKVRSDKGTKRGPRRNDGELIQKALASPKGLRVRLHTDAPGLERSVRHRRVIAGRRAPHGWRTIRVLEDGRRLVEAPRPRKAKGQQPPRPKAKRRPAGRQTPRTKPKRRPRG